MNRCESCNGRGWLLQDNDEHGLRIERCDTCEEYESDEVAVRLVATLAAAAEGNPLNAKGR